MIFFFPSIKYFLLCQVPGWGVCKTPNPPSRGVALRRSSLFNMTETAARGKVKEMLNVVSYVNTA